MVTEREIEEWFCLNEIWDSEDIICPYCGHEYPRKRHYNKNKHDEMKCVKCVRMFDVVHMIQWIHNILPRDEEIKDMLEKEKEKKKNGNKK